MGKVSALTITDSGNGLYTTAPTVKISLPNEDSANATATATVAGGNITAITLTDSGIFYTTPPIVTIEAPDSGRDVSASIISTGIGHTNGQNYNTTGGTGTGFIIRSLSSGGLTNFSIIDGGKDYLTGDSVQTDNGQYFARIRIDSVGPNTLATAVANVDSNAAGKISSITITAAGTQYDSNPTVTIQTVDSAGGGPSDYRATATCTIDSNGFVNTLSITDSGAGYDSAPTVQFIGGTAVDSDYQIGDSASQTLTGGVKVSGEVMRVIKESDGEFVRYIMMGHVGADDGKYHTFTTGTQLINSSRGSRNNGYEIISVSDSDNKLMATEQNTLFSTSSDDFLDFSENNPFGDPEDQ